MLPLIKRFAALLTAVPLQETIVSVSKGSSAIPFDAEWDAFVAKTMKQFHLPGLSMSVVHGNETYAKGYGKAILPDVDATPETLYYTGSTTKSMVAASIMQLIEESANYSEPLTLTTTISSLIPEDFVLPDEYATEHTTLEDAFSHRTGMPSHDNAYGGDNVTAQDIVRSLRYLPMSQPFRTTWQYCNPMYLTIAYVAEILTRRWLGDYLKDKIWSPLGMKSTFFSLKDARDAGKAGGPTLATGYFWNDTSSKFLGEDPMDVLANGGAGGVISNVLDYATYLRAMMEEDDRILSKSSYKELKTPRSIVPETFLSKWFTGRTTYGLGWQFDIYCGVEVISHSGGMNGFSTQMAYIPAKKWGFTIVTNTEFPGSIGMQSIWLAAMDKLLSGSLDDAEGRFGDFEKRVRKIEHDWASAKHRLFPRAPSKGATIPPTLPLKAYTGTYTHRAYGNLTLELSRPTSPWLSSKDDVLHADRLARVWQHVIDLEHVNAEHFLAWQSPPNASPSSLQYEAHRAEFRIGVDGKPVELGVGYEGKLDEEKIWFQRVS